MGEIALVPVTGGIFTITMTHVAGKPTDGTTQSVSPSDSSVNVTETVLWDRKIDGGFPETKELKNRVRNIIEPNRDLGHIDRSLKKNSSQQPGLKEDGKSDSPQEAAVKHEQQDSRECEDCK